MTSHTAELTSPAASDPMALLPCHRRLVLTGFMGAGKTTIGRQLAVRLGWKFLDLDALVETRAGATVPAIFATHGEPHFRRLESQELASALGRNHIVLALGGGAPEVLTNRLLIEQTPGTTTIFLDAPFSVLFERCMTQALAPAEGLANTPPGELLGLSRPILADPVAAEARFQARHPVYRRLAHHTIQTADLTTEQAVAAIVSQLTPTHASALP